MNFILGVEDETSNKTNGVGKSLSIEFINFVLMKRKSNSRVSLVPSSILPKETSICLDLEIDGEEYTIKRSIEKAEEPFLIFDDRVTTFSKAEDLTAFLGEKMFAHAEGQYPSFRIMMGPLIRDERSEFKSIVGCYDTNERASDDYSPHLYLLGLSVDIYRSIKAAIIQIDDLTRDIKKIKENVLLLRQKDIQDARSDLNELDSEVAEIERSIDALENVSGYEFIKGDIIELEDSLESLRREKALLGQQLTRTKLITSERPLDNEEVSEFYAQISARLGELIKHDLDQVFEFKKKIDEYQNQLIREQRDTLLSKISGLNDQIGELDRQYTSKLEVLDQQGALKNLKQTYAAFQTKADEASQLRAFIGRCEELEAQKQIARSNKESELLRLQSNIIEARKTLESFERTILDIHEYVQGNRKASFEIKQTSKKQVVEIVMRIDDDGSHSVEREKVFIYDLALLLNEDTRKRHPGILIHDNIFDVDQDTLLKSLRYLTDRAKFDVGQQYILTLNADRLDDVTKRALAPHVRAEFTKQHRFLKAKYQEQR